jgi:hypothetical protein
MARSKGIKWLEDQTRQAIDEDRAPVAQERHLSVRLSDDLASGLEAIASERGVTVSHLVRELLVDAVAERKAVASLDAKALADRLAADAAELRRRLAG